jgi:myo-inositol-1(or 4)-monophosphatase
VAAGYYDGFFETGLHPWDIAAGSLMITEAGGLIGNFTGEADFLYQREVVAGNPKIYGQLVHTLAPYTQVSHGEALAPHADAAAPISPEAALALSLGAGDAAVAPEAAPTAEVAPEKKKAVRIRKADLPSADDAPF